MKKTIIMISLLVITLSAWANQSSGDLLRTIKSGNITYLHIGISQPNVEDCYGTSAPVTGIYSNWINIFPNPSPGRFLLEVNLSQPGTPLIIGIYDIAGKAVFKITETPDGIVFQKDLDVGHLQKGVYLIRITGNDRVGVKRIIIY